jgi:hypothetical protein
MHRVVVCSLAFAVLSQPNVSAAQSQAFCEQMNQIVDATASNFLSLRGARRASSYESRIVLQGADNCRVTNYDGFEFTCTWRIANPDELERQFDVFVKGLAGCFPNGSFKGQRLDEFFGHVRPAAATFIIRDRAEVVIRRWTEETTSNRPRISLVVSRR